MAYAMSHLDSVPSEMKSAASLSFAVKSHTLKHTVHILFDSQIEHLMVSSDWQVTKNIIMHR